MSTIKILDMRKRWSLDRKRQNLYDMHVEYSVDGERGYFVIVPEEDATPERIQADIHQAERQRLEVTRLEFEV